MDTSDLTDATNVDSAALQEVTLMNIQQLQKTEQNFYQELEKWQQMTHLISRTRQIVKRINDLSQMRTTMFGQLEDMYRGIQGELLNQELIW